MSKKDSSQLLKCPCPTGCGNPTHYQWTHAKCSKNLKINTKGEIFCENCNEISHMKNWYFQCMKHSEYKKTTSTTFVHALSMAINLDPNIDMDFVIELVTYIRNNQY
jgi:hypothetical protein